VSSSPGAPAGAGAGEPRGSFYELVGGHAFFVRLVARFYEGVAADPVLSSMYPEDDLGPASERLRMFLEQYWGGPTTYSDLRGHPRLRMRHAPFVIDDDARERWLSHMRAALDDQGLPPDLTDEMWRYFTMAAFSMVNAPTDLGAGPSIRQEPLA
jgi:hemoglobin